MQITPTALFLQSRGLAFFSTLVSPLLLLLLAFSVPQSEACHFLGGYYQPSGNNLRTFDFSRSSLFGVFSRPTLLLLAIQHVLPSFHAFPHRIASIDHLFGQHERRLGRRIHVALHCYRLLECAADSADC